MEAIDNDIIDLRIVHSRQQNGSIYVRIPNTSPGKQYKRIVYKSGTIMFIPIDMEENQK